MKNLFTVLLLFLFLIACQDYDEDVVPLVGTYEAQIVAVSNPFTMAVSYDSNDDIFIDALFDGVEWATVSADIDNEEEALKRIKVPEQTIWDNISIEGEGFFLDNSMQLDYTIYYTSGEVDYTLVATKL